MLDLLQPNSQPTAAEDGRNLWESAKLVLPLYQPLFEGQMEK
jgi:hypothetical protein